MASGSVAAPPETPPVLLVVEIAVSPPAAGTVMDTVDVVVEVRLEGSETATFSPRAAALLDMLCGADELCLSVERAVVNGDEVMVWEVGAVIFFSRRGWLLAEVADFALDEVTVLLLVAELAVLLIAELGVLLVAEGKVMFF